MSQLFRKLRQFDAYSKPLEDFRIKTLSGGAVTLISGLVMSVLFVSELALYLQTETVEELFVDSSSGDGHKVEIKFDIVFPSLSCAFITVDAMDVSGEHQSDVQHSVWKIKLDKEGKQSEDTPQKEVILNTKTPESAVIKIEPNCGSCYGAETAERKCCNTCEDVKMAYRERGWGMRDIDTIDQCKGESWAKKLSEHQNEGCQVYGVVRVAKVAGNFHIAPGETLKDRHSHVHDLHSLGPHKFNTSHKIKKLSFGGSYPGKSDPLDNHTATTHEGGRMFQYFVKVVPTMYVFSNQKESLVLTNQFSVTKHQKVVSAGIGDGLPGLFVQYEFSPLMVKLTERRKSFAHFLVSVCAIIGGVFTVASLIDSFIYHSSKVLEHKMDLGKAT